MAHRSGAIETMDLERVVVDTTVQEKAIAHSTRPRDRELVDLAKREGVKLRLPYPMPMATATCGVEIFGIMDQLLHRNQNDRPASARPPP